MPEFITRVYGIPTPAGSKTAVPTKAGARLLDGGTPAARQARAVWRQDVIACARTDMETQGVSFLVGPLGCDMFFYLPRPKSIPARRKDGTIPRPITRPDKGKLERATEDALTIAGVWNDDSQVVEGFSAKWYATDDTPPGAFIQVWTL